MTPDLQDKRTDKADKGARNAVPPGNPQNSQASGDSRGLQSEEEIRRSLVEKGICRAENPAVVLELYGGLRLKTGCERLPLHARNVAEAIDVLRKVYPKADNLLPCEEELGEFYRFSINGRSVTSDLSHPLQQNDHLIFFSASVGG